MLSRRYSKDNSNNISTIKDVWFRKKCNIYFKYGILIGLDSILEFRLWQDENLKIS